MNQQKVESIIKELLIEIGEDPNRQGLKKTPERISKALAFLASGYSANPSLVIHGATFAQESNNMVIVRDIEIYSLCEHHMLPFFGRCHIGYLPKDTIFGVSKLARLADMYARRLQIQERLTDQIAMTIMNEIKALGVGVVIEARHLCMMMRGVEKQNSILTTSSVIGTFRDSHATRTEFLSLISKQREI
jgi:GTP cyclohydrolase I